MDWFLYDRDLRHERVKCSGKKIAKYLSKNKALVQAKAICHYYLVAFNHNNFFKSVSKLF